MRHSDRNIITRCEERDGAKTLSGLRIYVHYLIIPTLCCMQVLQSLIKLAFLLLPMGVYASVGS